MKKVICNRCKGAGIIAKQTNNPFSFMWQICPDCAGEGTILLEDERSKTP